MSQNRPNTQLPQNPNEPRPNRQTTPISVEVTIDRQLRNVRWFTDLQQAYLWIQQQVEDVPLQEIDMLTFEETCHRMDQRWSQNRRDGLCVAATQTHRQRTLQEPDSQGAMEAHHRRQQQEVNQIAGRSTGVLSTILSQQQEPVQILGRPTGMNLEQFQDPFETPIQPHVVLGP